MIANELILCISFFRRSRFIVSPESTIAEVGVEFCDGEVCEQFTPRARKI